LARRAARAGLLAAAALLAVLLGSGRPCVAAPASGAKGGWPSRQEGADLVVETPNYRVRTDLGNDIGQIVAGQQEALFAELVRRMAGIKPYRPIERLDVLVLGAEAAYLKRLGAEAAGSRGIYLPAKDTLAAWGSRDEIEIILETLRHEGTHQFMCHYFGADCPVWLNEGMAVFYEHGQFSRGTLEIGEVPAERVGAIQKALAENRAIPLATLLAMSNEQWLASVHAGQSHAYLQYCQSWSMVQFLAYGEKGKYRSAFEQYLYFVSRGHSSKEAWDKAFGGDMAGFESRWRQYVQGLKPSGAADCRLHLQLLGMLLVRARDKPEPWKDIGTFRKALLEERLGHWTIRLSDGGVIRSEDRKAMATLFRCPLDKQSVAASNYEMAEGKPGEPPVLRCRLHTGLVLETSYEKVGGALTVKVLVRPATGSP
jgi:hypothetical protein